MKDQNLYISKSRGTLIPALGEVDRTVGPENQ